MIRDIVGTLKDDYKNLTNITSNYQQVALISIELEREPAIYKYNIQLQDGMIISARVMFDFPYLTTIPVGQAMYIRRNASDELELKVVTDRGEYLGIMDKGRPEPYKSWNVAVSNGKIAKKTTLHQNDMETYKRINAQLNNPQMQIPTGPRGMIPSSQAITIMQQTQMPQPNSSATTKVNQAERLPSYRGYVLITDDVHFANYIDSDTVGYHVKYIEPIVDKCSCCGYPKIAINGNKMACPVCGSKMMTDYNHMRNMLINLC